MKTINLFIYEHVHSENHNANIDYALSKDKNVVGRNQGMREIGALCLMTANEGDFSKGSFFISGTKVEKNPWTKSWKYCFNVVTWIGKDFIIPSKYVKACRDAHKIWSKKTTQPLLEELYNKFIKDELESC